MRFSIINTLIDTVKELYTIELLFTDLKVNRLYNCNCNDEKFIKPNLKKRNALLNKLKRLCNYNISCFNKIHKKIIEESYNTIRDNSEDINKLINYSVDLVLKNNCNK